MIACLDILGLRAAISGPGFLIEDLVSEYPHARKANGHQGLGADVVLIWNGLTCHVEPWGAEFPAEAEELISPITRVLLRRAMARANPRTVFLHGNAVIREGGLLLFAGPSGYGKTTLSLAVLERFGPHAAMLADDLLAIELDSGCVLPYPRSSRVMERGREVFRLSPNQHSLPVPLAGAGAVFLQSGEPPGAATASRSLVLSVWNDAAKALFAASSAGSHALGRYGGVPVVTPASRLPERELSRLVEDLHDAGVLVLAVGVPREPRSPARPPKPCIRPLGWGDALDCIMENLAGPTPVKGAALAMALVRAFSETSCWMLTPGGSPEHSLDILLQEASRAA